MSKILLLHKVTKRALGRLLGGERGSHFVELAIGLPLFIALLFSMFDIARISLAQTAVRAGVYHAARRAVAVRRPVDNTYLNSLFADSRSTSRAALNHRLFRTDNAGIDYYTKNAPQTLFRSEVLAMAYAYEILGRSFGKMKYPCTDEPNCAACSPMRDTDPEYLELFCKDADCAGGPGTEYSVRYLGLRCTIQVPIMSTTTFMGWLPPSMAITSTAFVPMENYSLVEFDPNA